MPEAQGAVGLSASLALMKIGARRVQGSSDFRVVKGEGENGALGPVARISVVG